MAKLATLTRDRRISDTEAFVAYLEGREDVRAERLAVVGYCMGGNIALTVAGVFKERFYAIASFHGGRLAVEAPESPHRFVAGITGKVYVGGADRDDSFDLAQKERLEAALGDAGVAHRVEIYEGALHGYAVPDHAVFNAEAAERHWAALFELLG